MTGRGYMLRSKNDYWRTPKNVVDAVKEAFGGQIDLDPCGAVKSLVGARKQYLLSRGEDGLKLPWEGKIFVNPPFSTSRFWVKRAAEEVLGDDSKELIMLLPARVDTKSFHEVIVPSVDLICFWKGRLTFVGAPASAPFPVMFCYWGPRWDAFKDAFHSHGHTVEVRECLPHDPELYAEATRQNGLGRLTLLD
jgi:phage N-6-adenine-methyltransferase